MSEVKVSRKTTKVGVVDSNGADKSVVVKVENFVMHPLYGKFIRRSTKVHAHDEANERVDLGQSADIGAFRQQRLDKVRNEVRKRGKGQIRGGEGDLPQRLEGAGRLGVVDHRVEAPEAAHRLLDHSPAGLGVGRVGEAIWHFRAALDGRLEDRTVVLTALRIAGSGAHRPHLLDNAHNIEFIERMQHDGRFAGPVFEPVTAAVHFDDFGAMQETIQDRRRRRHHCRDHQRSAGAHRAERGAGEADPRRSAGRGR